MPVIPDGYANFDWTMIYTGSAREWHCTLGVRVLGGWNPPDVQEMAQFGYDAWETNILTGQDSSMSLTRCQVHWMDSGTEYFAEVNDLNVGGVASAFPPPNFCCLVRKTTLLAGRANRGRMFIPSIVSEPNVDELGMIDGSTQSDIQDQLDAFYAYFQAGTGHPDSLFPTVLHTSGVAPPADIAAFAVQQLGATQRRRMRAS